MFGSKLRPRRPSAAALVLLTLVGVVAVFVTAGSASGTLQLVSISVANDANHDGVFSNTENVNKNATYPLTVTYRLALANSPIAATHIQLSDDQTSTLTSATHSPTCSSLNGTIMAPSTAQECYYDVSLAGPGTSPLINTATVRWGNGADFATGSSTVNFPSLSVQKSSTTTLVTTPGQVVPYTYTVTNTGTVTVTGINVSDNNVDAAPSCPLTSLAPTASMTCTAQHTATVGELAAGAVKNTVIVSSNEASDATDKVSIAASLPSVGGMFVVGNLTVGDVSQANGKQVTFWGAQWWKLNQLSGGLGPAAFKGFEDSPAAPTCGSNWTTDPGNSTPPPATIPGYIELIVSSSVTKTGAVIGGDTVHVLIVKTDPGYQGDPGHAGTGTIAAVVC